VRSVDDLLTVRPDNRLVGYPYTKYMVSVMDVDMAAALVVATHERADALGVPADHRVYPRGYCYTTDPVLVAARPEMWRSPAMAVAASTALEGAGIGIDDVAHLDLYSCFGSSLHFACDALGISPLDDRGLTVTGGLPYHGGPGSGYLVHAIAKMADVLRADPGAFGAVSGVGMHMTKHVYGVYSTEPGPLVPPDRDAIQARLDSDNDIEVVAEHEGDATVLAYSIVHDRSGAPEWGLLVCDLGEGRRTYARLDDATACAAAERDELVGRKVTLMSASRTGPAGEVRTNFVQV
jgi:acetyl-CoA C-acetyltransferase